MGGVWWRVRRQGTGQGRVVGGRGRVVRGWVRVVGGWGHAEAGRGRVVGGRGLVGGRRGGEEELRRVVGRGRKEEDRSY